jgi:uncharacterized MAPEG superfamily protein
MQMAVELKLLGVAIVVGLVQLLWAAAAARAHQGDLKWAAGPRDTPMPLGGVAARLDRAFWNFAETFPFFAAAVLACAAAGKLGSDLTVWGSAAYVVARAVYAPLYASGIPTIRTLVWLVAMAGLVMVLAALFR